MSEEKVVPILWGFDGQEILTDDNEHDAIQNHLENISDGDPLPETVSVNGYAREEVSDELAKECLDHATELINERLMERHGYEDEIEFNSEALEKFKVATLNLCKTFPSWSCEVICTNIIDTKKWVTENREDWIKDGSVTWEQ